MTPEKYQQFTEQLVARLSSQEHLLGLVAVGSMARKDYVPDEWSDHDFFVIVESGSQEFFRNNLMWLPESNEIIFSFRETAHGVKVLYRNAHLLEFAVFDLNELYLAQINRYRVLLDRCGLEVHLQKIRERTRKQSAPSDPSWLYSQFITNLLVGVSRHRRGERLSGHFFVKYSALRSLVLLCHAYLDSSSKDLLDDIDPFRRIEFAFPDVGLRLNKALLLETPDAAVEMFQFAKEAFQDRLPGYNTAAVNAVSQFLRGDI